MDPLVSKSVDYLNGLHRTIPWRWMEDWEGRLSLTILPKRLQKGFIFLFPRLLFVDGLGFPFYKRSVAVVLVTELKIKVLSSGTYCFVMSLMTSWAAHPPIKAATACNSAAP